MIKEIDIGFDWLFTPEGGKSAGTDIPKGGWLKQGFDCESGVYEKVIFIPDTGKPSSVWLEVGAVNHHAVYYIGKDKNSMKKIHDEVTAFTPQKVDLTPYTKVGEEYLLRIHVTAFENGKPVAPHCANWCGFIARGIFRYACLRIYPEVFISDGFIKTYTSDNSLQCDIWITNTSNRIKFLSVTGEFHSLNGNTRVYPGINEKSAIIEPLNSVCITLDTVEWSPGRDSWWWPNIPYKEGYKAQMHILRLSLRESDETIHTCDFRFGFREIKQDGRYFTLNGERVNFRGDNLQAANYDRIDYGGKGDAIGTLPGFLPPSAENPGWPEAVNNFLKLNFSVQRQHMVPWTPYMLDTCDEMGLMLISESAARLNDFDRIDGRAPYEIKCLQDIVRRDRNHPSIIRWSLSNEPECNDPVYHLELYNAVKTLDDTRPVSEDIWSVDYLTEPLDHVFGLLLDKPDFTWIEHYLSMDENDNAIHDCSHYNDGLIPLPDRPFGLGEANLNCLSTPRGLTCFATTIALLRARDASDIRPYVLLSNWASSIPGVRSYDFFGEEDRQPEYGEDNLPYPWSNPKLMLLQKACHPFLAFDYHFWEINKKSNAAGVFPVEVPVLTADTEITREIIIFNDSFCDKEIKLQWEIRLGSCSNEIFCNGSKLLHITPGFSVKELIKFKTPDKACVISLTLMVSGSGTCLFRDDSTVYEVPDDKIYSMEEMLN